MDRVRRNRRAWDTASRRYVDDDVELRRQAASGRSLTDIEVMYLVPLLHAAPAVLHLQSGHGLDDIDLARNGARSVLGVDFSAVAAAAAYQRARAFNVAVRYAVAEAARLPLAGGAVDLVYTGKGALMWLPDLKPWAAEIGRVLRLGGHLFVFEQHPAAPLWTRDVQCAALRADRSYFGGTRRNDSFPASAVAQYSTSADVAIDLDAVEWQWTIADVVTALLAVGFCVTHLGEHPEPFWRPTGARADAWTGRLPNTFSLVARCPG